MEKKNNVNEYWAKRQAKTQDRLTQKNIVQTEKQLAKYYASTMEKIVGEFVKTYEKIFNNTIEGKEITPADLYKLDKYWQMQTQLEAELQKLGQKQSVLFLKKFQEQYKEVYESLKIMGIDSTSFFNPLDKQNIEQMIQQIWCADNKSWSDRIWVNMGKLKQTLNEELVACVVAGKSPRELKQMLQHRFNVSYSQANTIVRTEMAHIQTQAAQQRYKDYGLQYYEILGNDDDTCHNHSVDCHKMDGKRFLLNAMQSGVNAPPFHPNCRCCIVPVVEA